MKKNVIAVFGGSFNPPTNAHINLAKQILEKYSVKKIVFVPVSTKYNKNGLAPDKDRFEMLQKICNKNDKMQVSSIELDTPRQLYTIETLKILQQQNPEDEIYFILGTDNLKELDTWHNAQELISTYKILVLKRNNDNVKDIIENTSILKKHEGSFIELKDIEQIDLSSSQIREKLQKGENIKEVVPEEIYKDILRIYGKPNLSC